MMSLLQLVFIIYKILDILSSSFASILSRYTSTYILLS